MAALTKRYGVGKPQVRDWLVAAGIPIRTQKETGRRRQLQPPDPEVLRRLYEGEHLSSVDVGRRLGASSQTVNRWLREAGIALRKSPLKDRARGTNAPVQRPSVEELVRLYVTERHSVDQVAVELGATPHLVRTWMDDVGIARRAPGGVPGRRRTPLPRRKPPPPDEELRRLRQGEGWTLKEMAAHFGVHSDTVTRWLKDADIPPPAVRRGPVRAALPHGITVEELVRRYRTGTMTALELASQTGVPYARLTRELHEAGGVDRTRSSPAISAAQGRRIEQLYQEQEMTLTAVAAEVGLSQHRVRRHLQASGVSIVRRTHPRRGVRLEAPVDQVSHLYVDEGYSAGVTGEILDVERHVVLRTGHDHGLPIRAGGLAVIPAEVRLIEALYADDEVATVLHRHGVPHRPPVGGIAVRFPKPVPLTPELVDGLYHDAGCSTNHIELLTGQSRSLVEERMRQWGIPLRARSAHSPALSRFRRARRLETLQRAVELYEKTRSTSAVAAEFGCAQDTVRRWLIEVGIAVPGRGRWDRTRQR